LAGDVSVSELSEEEKALFRAATERRKAAGIRLKRFAIMCDEKQVESLNELWNAWTERWGKQHAVDELLRLMSLVETRLRDKERAQETVPQG
jgi:hypothetical protein